MQLHLTVLLSIIACLLISHTLLITKSYYKNSDSAIATYRVLISSYGSHNRPTMQAIGKIVKKSEETAVITNIEKCVHHRFARSGENIAIVSESVALDPNVSISRRSQELGLSYGTSI